MQGQIKEGLAFHESYSLEAEEKAAAGSQPYSYWETAMLVYREASRAARISAPCALETVGEKV
jgi:hypothetical protein